MDLESRFSFRVDLNFVLAIAEQTTSFWVLTLEVTKELVWHAYCLKSFLQILPVSKESLQKKIIKH